MKMYKFVFRTHNEDCQAHEYTGVAYEHNARAVFDYLVETYVCDGDKYEGKVVPMPNHFKVIPEVEAVEVISSHKIDMSVVGLGFGENDVFIGQGYERIAYDGDCVFVSENYLWNRDHVDTRNNPAHLRYNQDHPSRTDYEARVILRTVGINL